MAYLLLLQNCLVRLEGLLDKALGVIALHLQVGQVVLQVQRRLGAVLHLALRLAHQRSHLALDQVVVRLRNSLAVVLRTAVASHDTLCAYWYLQQNLSRFKQMKSVN